MTGRSLAALGAALLMLVSSACEPRDQTPRGRGARVFQRSCSGCHGADGRGVMRLGLVKPPRDLTNPEFQAKISDEQLRRVIRIGKGQMPAFGGLLSEEDVANVIAFVRTLAPGAQAPKPSPLLPSSTPSPSSSGPHPSPDAAAPEPSSARAEPAPGAAKREVAQ